MFRHIGRIKSSIWAKQQTLLNPSQILVTYRFLRSILFSSNHVGSICRVVVALQRVSVADRSRDLRHTASESNPDNTVSILLGVSSAGSPWIMEIDYAVTSQILLARAWPHLCVTIHGQACLGAPQPVTVARGQPLRTNLQGQQAWERGEWKKIFHVQCREWRRAASHTRAKRFSCFLFLSLSLSLSPLGLSVSSPLCDIHLNQVLTTSSLRTDSETPWRPDQLFFLFFSQQNSSGQLMTTYFRYSETICKR